MGLRLVRPNGCVAAQRPHRHRLRAGFQSMRSRKRPRVGANRRVRCVLSVPARRSQRRRADHLQSNRRFGAGGDVQHTARRAGAAAVTRASSLIVAIALTPVAARANAQSAAWTDRGYLSAGADVRVVGSSFGELIHPIDFAEAAVVNTTYKSKLAPGVEFGGGVRVWRDFALGATATWVSRADSGSVNAQVPHPFVFGKPRAVSGSASLARDETAVHVQAVWMIPVASRWQFGLAAGPSWMALHQDLVDDVT